MKKYSDLKHLILIALFCSLHLFASAQEIHTGMNKVSLDLTPDANGTPQYSVAYAGKNIIEKSSLGFILGNDENFYSGFVMTSADSSHFDETWKTVWGEYSRIRNHYKQIVVHLKQRSTNRLLDITFRVFEDGVGFRYSFPKQNGLKYFIVKDELTNFQLTGDHKTFWIPGDYDSNEYPYTVSPVSRINNKAIVAKSTDIAVKTVPDSTSVQTPLMMKTADGIYLNIHEAALVGYAAMQLHVDPSTYKLTSALVPDAYGNKAYLHAPFSTPWRTIIVSDKATDILASKMILNLNEPSKIQNTSWIKPMKFVGVWWEMQTGKGTWNYAWSADNVDAKGNLIPNGKHSANTNNVKRYIDFAAKNGIAGVLVEGWNTGWEDWFGNWKEDVFDFVTPYPDFNAKELQQYAAKKGVHLIMHNETSGSATNYERQMDTAFRFMNKYGYTSVKTGYVGKIIPRGEHHDGQWMVNHYNRVAEKAAAYKVMIDVHEPMRPTGIQRTWPNWLASEAGRGNEYHAFSNGNDIAHETILPFTRLMGGPMDYTPGIFKLRNYTSDSSRGFHSTLAKELALYVTIYSPLQMAADLPENYEANPAPFQFIKDVAVDWDTTIITEAEPGEYVTMARKEKGKDHWFIGAITGENKRTSTIDLNFLNEGQSYTATVYGDAEDANWKTNPESVSIKQLVVRKGSRLVLNLKSGGGAAVSIFPSARNTNKNNESTK
jgi:glucan 1,4-alpha-glucosidase